MTPGARPRVLVVDDHALIRARVTAMLSPACDIVGTASDGVVGRRSLQREVASL